MGFPFGGWQAPLLDEVAGAQVGAAYEGTDALLLGRWPYDIFAAYWPYQEGGQDNEIATLFNRVPKYVASRSRPDLSWTGFTQRSPVAGSNRSRIGDVRLRRQQRRTRNNNQPLTGDDTDPHGKPALVRRGQVAADNDEVAVIQLPNVGAAVIPTGGP